MDSVSRGPAAGPIERPLRIAIATLGRFHVLDLARELAALGHEVRFYSYVPRRRAERFGLPRDCHVALLPWLFPFLILQRLLPRRTARSFDKAIYRAANRVVDMRLKPCDVFIGMSGVYLEAAEAARARYGARIYLERGSRHIQSQSEILSAIPGAEMPAAFAVERELKGYALADRIVVPSVHVEKSFIERGIPRERLFRNRYGVDLRSFAPTDAPRGVPPTVLYVGTWSLRKGVDLLVSAVMSLEDVYLVHVGALLDAPFPRNRRFVHHAPVPQWKLAEYYSRAHVFALASHEEGLALVLAQAMACGLPVVCTDRTGGEDLKELYADQSLLAVVPSGDPMALANALKDMLPRALTLSGQRMLLQEQNRHTLSWRAYAERYAAEVSIA
jgi:glycosyltransferase involved in cell wall biosynthesis